MCATEQLYRNVHNVRKTKKKDVGNNNSTKVAHLKRDAAVSGELWVSGGECEIYDFVIFL